MKFQLRESLNSIFYDFDDDVFGEFEFEPDSDDIDRFTDEIMKVYPKAELEKILKDLLPNDYSDLDIEDQITELKDIVRDNTDLFDEDAYSFFEDEAYELYKDSAEYSKDPYAYYGLRQSDFY